MSCRAWPATVRCTGARWTGDGNMGKRRGKAVMSMQRRRIAGRGSGGRGRGVSMLGSWRIWRS
eukprot:817964-Prymnesium_polylepis.1